MSASTVIDSPTVRLIGYEPKSISGAILSMVTRSSLNSFSIIGDSAFFLIVFCGQPVDRNLQRSRSQVLKIKVFGEPQVLFRNPKRPAAGIDQRRVHADFQFSWVE